MTWEKMRLESLCTKITDGTHKTPKYVDSRVCFLSAKNLNQGYLDFTNCKYYPPFNTHLTVGWNKRSGSTFWIKELGYGA